MARYVNTMTDEEIERWKGEVGSGVGGSGVRAKELVIAEFVQGETDFNAISVRCGCSYEWVRKLYHDFRKMKWYEGNGPRCKCGRLLDLLYDESGKCWGQKCKC